MGVKLAGIWVVFNDDLDADDGDDEDGDDDDDDDDDDRDHDDDDDDDDEDDDNDRCPLNLYGSLNCDAHRQWSGLSASTPLLNRRVERWIDRGVLRGRHVELLESRATQVRRRARAWLQSDLQFLPRVLRSRRICPSELEPPLVRPKF